MIQLLFVVLVAEAAVAAALLFKTPLRKLAVLGIDRLKRGRRAPVAVKTVAGVVLALLASTIYSMTEISGRAGDPESGGGGGALSPTDQVLFSRHLLEASLMGYSLFLALVIDRLHEYIRELRGMKKNVEAVSKHNKMLEEAKHGRSEETKKYQEEIATLNEEMKKLKLQVQERTEEVHDAEKKSVAIQKQSETLLLEYDRLLEDNQHLREQLQSIDLRLSNSS